jgi:ataxia telangiectasia mutated family protein
MGGDILTDYLNGARDSAVGGKRIIRAELTFAEFNDQLYHSILARMRSPEHQHLERVMRDRRQELHRSQEIFDGWSERDKKDAKDEYRSLNRHLAALKKEVEGDKKSAKEGRDSLKAYLKQALGGYRRVLELSDDTDLEVVFKAVNIWVNHKYDVGVNEEMRYVNSLPCLALPCLALPCLHHHHHCQACSQSRLTTHYFSHRAISHSEIIKRTKSFKFVPLSYQMISLLGASSDPSAESSGSRSSSRVNSPFGISSSGGLDYSSGQQQQLQQQPMTDSELEERAAQEKRFKSLMQSLVLKLCCDHPYHCLPQLFATVNKDETGAGSLAVFQAKLDITRVQVADLILSHLRDSKQVGVALSRLVADTDVFLKNYITLAMVNVKDYVADQRAPVAYDKIPGRGCTPKHKLGIPFNRCMENLHGRPAVLTLTPTLQKDGYYSHEDYPLTSRGVGVATSSAAYSESRVVYMTGIEDDFVMADTGISVPKIIKVEGSDGVTYKQLVKGNDDMRQDAVMEQVFAHVNHTLSKNEETRKRRLNIRTYKCVPCTPQTGVIQWVEGCRPLGDFLLSNERSLHVRYYPHDWTPAQCREYMKEAHTPAEKEKALKDVFAHFHPAFRFRFIEQYPDPAQWLSCRLNYTRSVAVNSMIGYTLAIGDRHTNNILVDQTTSEVVHIDFGIVFDQGKLLPTPETVPFRLSRDVVDGMGITGVEGTFRRSCEQVLRVIRKNASQVLTICEVVIHDPLYKWSLSPLEARKKQEGTKIGKGKGKAARDGSDKAAGAGTAASGGGETIGGPSDANGAVIPGGGGGGAHQVHRDAAERMLMTLKSKLQGYENPAGEALSVEGHVEALITSATDVRNLSKLFVGWAPWI